MTLTLFLTMLGTLIVGFALFVAFLLVVVLKGALLLSPLWAPPLVRAWWDRRRVRRDCTRA